MIIIISIQNSCRIDEIKAIITIDFNLEKIFIDENFP